MKRILVVVLTLGLIVGAVAVPASAGKKKKPRVVEADYFAPAYFQWTPDGEHNIGGVSFPTSATEKSVSIEIEDMLGQPVSAAAGQDPEGDGQVATTNFCGSIDDLPIEGGLDVTVFVFVGPCTSPPGPGFATQGTVIATISS